jgi:tRNA A-37 threonylcarbamoyl transferase component Bud32
VIKFTELNLVKVGDPSRVRLEEALALRAVKQAFPNNEVPVPELYGWRINDGKNFIYMSYISGPTLRDAWRTLTFAEKELTTDQLSQIVQALRRIGQGSSGPFTGTLLARIAFRLIKT